MPWLELRINTSREKVTAFETALGVAGALSITLEDSADTPIFEPALGETPLWQSTRVTGLFEADIDTQSVETQIPGLNLEHWLWHVVEDKDWEREWMQNYKPIHCHNQLWVCPSWCEPPDPKAVNLMLDPGLAFGTGTHPTTFMCLQWLAAQELTDKHIVDYGCGSGILGIAALLLGAQSATGIDIDPQALLATAENAKRNGLAPEQFPVFLPKKAPILEAEVVVANILAGPLVELAPHIRKYLPLNGLLCLSGVLATQAQTVMEAYQQWVDFNPIKTLDEWALLSGKVARH